MRARLALATLALLLTPLATAEYGPESEDGWPVNVDGEALRPPVVPVVLTTLPPEVAAAYGLSAAEAADPLNKAGPFTAYPYYPLLTAEVQRLADEHPDLVKLTSAGKSTLGLELWLLEIADHARIERGEGLPLEEREVVWIDGGHHSNEYSGVYFVTEWAQFLLDEYETNETAKWIVENRHTFILPMVNPDGSHAFGRLNANGVNINRNYPVGWAGLRENPVMNNPGPSAASEVETQDLLALWDAVRPDYVASIHCCGNLWLYPYGIEGVLAVDELMFSRVCDEAFADVREDCGPIWSTIYPASGSSVDSVYELAGSAAFGYEMSGRGNIGIWGQPATDMDVREQERESWAGVLHAFLNVEKYGARPAITAIEGDAARLRITIENDGYGNLTHGNVTVGGATVALPFLAPGERATVEVAGAFAPGALEARLDYEKRTMAGVQGERTIGLTLVETSAGLVGILDGSEAVATAGTPDARVPLPGALLVVALLVGAGLRRR